MLRLTSRRSALCLRRLCTKAEEKPPKRKFNPRYMEKDMQEFLDRESPLLTLSAGKVERPPLLRSLFANQFDERFLTYPEILEPAEVHRVTQLYEKLKEYVDSLEPHSLQESIPSDVVNTLRSFGVYGALVPDKSRGMNFTEFSRILEAFGTQPALAATVIMHSAAGIFSLMEHGTADQKTQFLPKVSSGEWMATLAMHESDSGTDAASVQTNIRLSNDESHYLLNGTKTYVTNGRDAKLFVVICAVNLLNARDPEKQVAAVLVERDTKGVKVEKTPEMIGLKGSGLSTVTFENVNVPLDRILGNTNSGLDITMSIHNAIRCMLPSAIVATAREILNKTVKHAVKTHRYRKTLDEFQMARKRVADMASDIYAMESASYLTNAIVDAVKDPDYVLEAAATRLYCTQAARRIQDSCFELSGAAGLANNDDLSRWSKDLRTFEAFEGTPDLCRLLISLSGLQFAGRLNEKNVIVLRDPLTNPFNFIKLRYNRYFDKIDEPKLPKSFYQFIHPKLFEECTHLEYCLNRLAYATYNILEQYGLEATQHQILLENLTNIAIDVYVLASCISRASRSFCIGLQNCDEEMKMCKAFTKEVVDRISHAVKQIEYGVYGATLMATVATGETIFNN